MTPLGLPLPLWGLLCLFVAAIWVFVWPRKQAPAAGPRRFILRWFHALVWLALALAAFVAGFNLLGGLPTARALAWLSLAFYLTFLFTSLTTKAR